MVTMCKGDATCNSKFLDLRSGFLVLGFKRTQMKLGKKRKKENLEITTTYATIQSHQLQLYLILNKFLLYKVWIEFY